MSSTARRRPRPIADYLLTVDSIKAWEKEHGDDRAGHMGAAAHRLVQAQRQRGNVPQRRRERPHSPGPTAEAIKYLISKGVIGWGSETVGTDAGSAGGMNPPSPRIR